MAYQWENYIEIDPNMLAEHLGQVKGALNWLEDHSPIFMEVLWDLEQRKSSDGFANLKDKVLVKESDSGAWYSFADDPDGKYNKDTVFVEFNYDFYLGQDGRLYEFSLNETLLHELVHSGQMLHRDPPQVFEEAPKAAEALEEFLTNRGVPQRSDVEYGSRIPTIYDYFVFFKNLQTNEYDFDPEILNDPEYQKLLQNLIDVRREMEAETYNIEDYAMDRTDELRAIIGKPGRGDYGHSLYIEPEGMSYSDLKTMTVTIYSDTPELLRKNGVPSWEGPEELEISPSDTGEIKRHFQYVTQTTEAINNAWNKQYNTNRMNISPDEWLFISEARKNFFEGRTISELTEDDRIAYDTLIKELMSGFNQSSDNDALNPDIKQKGLSEDLSTLSTQTGWKWDN